MEATPRHPSLTELAGRRVLILGGAGFIGSATVIEACNVDAEVYVLDNLLHGVKENVDTRATFVPGDILDAWRLLKTMNEVRPDFVMNFVGDTYIPAAYDAPKRFVDINVTGCLNVLMACKYANVSRVLHVSSTEVYGDRSGTALDESQPITFNNSYAVTKIAGDGLCYTLNKEHGVPVVVARIFNAYGPRETEPYVIAEIIKQLRDGSEVQLGNLKSSRDFTYVHDTAKALLLVMLSSVPAGESVNVGSGVTYSVEYLLNALARIMGRYTKLTVTTDPRRLRKNDIDSIKCDNRKLKRYTGWEPKVDIGNGLCDTVEWFEAHGSKWSWEAFVEGTILYK